MYQYEIDKAEPQSAMDAEEALNVRARAGWEFVAVDSYRSFWIFRKLLDTEVTELEQEIVELKVTLTKLRDDLTVQPRSRRPVE